MPRQVLARSATLATAVVGISQTVSRIAVVGTVHTLHTVARDIETVVRVAEAAMAVVAGKSQAAARMIRIACSVVGEA